MTNRPMADCDCCGKYREVRQVWFVGMETWACAECTDTEDDSDRYEQETGEKLP